VGHREADQDCGKQAVLMVPGCITKAAKKCGADGKNTAWLPEVLFFDIR